MFTIITNDGATYYLVWDSVHIRGLCAFDAADVAGATNSGVPVIRIRNSSAFTEVYNEFNTAGDQSAP